MNSDKYIGMDVHQATISIAVLDSAGKLLMESILETKAATILQFIHGLRGNLYVTFEEIYCVRASKEILWRGETVPLWFRFDNRTFSDGAWRAVQSLDVALTHNNLGRLLTDLGRPDETVPLLEAAVAVLEDRLAPGHPHLSTARKNLRNAIRS